MSAFVSGTMKRSIALIAAGLVVALAVGLGCKGIDPKDDPNGKGNAMKIKPGASGGGGATSSDSGGSSETSTKQ